MDEGTDCGGSGDCTNCDGTCYVPDEATCEDVDCDECAGSGYCQRCDGSGEE